MVAQKDEADAKKARQAEVDEAQKKIAEIMVEAQAQVGAVLQILCETVSETCVDDSVPVWAHTLLPCSAHALCCVTRRMQVLLAC